MRQLARWREIRGSQKMFLHSLLTRHYGRRNFARRGRENIYRS